MHLDYDNFEYLVRCDEIAQIENHIEDNLKNKTDGKLHIVAHSLKEGSRIIDKVLSDSFGLA